MSIWIPGTFLLSTVGQGALIGAAAALPFAFLPATAGVAAFAAVGALSGGISYTTDYLTNPNAKWDWGDFFLSVGIGAGTAGLGRYILGRINARRGGNVTPERTGTRPPVKTFQARLAHQRHNCRNRLRSGGLSL